MAIEDIIKGLIPDMKAQVAENIKGIEAEDINIDFNVTINQNTYITKLIMPNTTAKLLATTDPDTLISLSNVTSAELQRHEAELMALSEPEQAQEITSTASATAVNFLKAL
ncbi:MAG: hypothetical protein ACYSR0_08725 [Planctomycetota bacterium]|jgi:hypothetical protein